MATTTVTQYPLSLQSFETVARLEQFVQPLFPILEKARDIGSHYYGRVKKHSPYTTQVLTIVEKLVGSASEAMSKKVQEKITENASKLESFDRTGVQLLDQVEHGKQRIEKALLGPAMFLLTVLNHVYLAIKPSSKIEEVTDSFSESITTITTSEEEVSLTQTYKVLGQRSLEIGSELFKISAKVLRPVRLTLVSRFPQLVVLEDKVQVFCSNWCFRSSTPTLLDQDLKQFEQVETRFEQQPVQDEVAFEEYQDEEDTQHEAKEQVEEAPVEEFEEAPEEFEEEVEEKVEEEAEDEASEEVEDEAGDRADEEGEED